MITVEALGNAIKNLKSATLDPKNYFSPDETKGAVLASILIVNDLVYSGALSLEEVKTLSDIVATEDEEDEEDED